jgi:cold shock CspA family protein
MRGVCKFYEVKIDDAVDADDVYFNRKVLERAGLATIERGAIVEFDVVATRDGRRRADNIRLVGLHLND